MKKIILIIILLLLSGCNYTDLNDMGIVSLMAIRYDNNEYTITLELRENVKNDDNASSVHTATDTSLEKTIEQISLESNRKLYFIDLDIILIDEETVNKKLLTILDFLTRDVSYGANYNIVIDNNPIKTINLLESNKKIAGDYIKNIFNNKLNNTINYKYSSFIRDFINKEKDVILPFGKINNEDYIIDEAVIFNRNIICNHIDFKTLQTYNLLNNVRSNYYYQILYHDKELIYKIADSKSKITYKDKIIITIDVNGSFIEMENVDLLDEEELNNILDLLNKEIKNNITNLVTILKSNDSDILGFKKQYFNSNRKRINSIKNMDYEINLNVKLDRKGLLFESVGDVYEE